MLAGFVLARRSAGLADSTIRGDTTHWSRSGLVRAAVVGDGAARRGPVFRHGAARMCAGDAGRRGRRRWSTYFEFLELRHKVELHELTGRVVECPIDEMNRPRMSVDAQAADPADRGRAGAAVRRVARGAGDVPQVRADRPQLHGGAVAADVGLRINEARMLDLDDVRWELGRFGKLNVRYGKGARRQGAAAAGGAVDQRRGPGAGVVHRGRVGPVRRRPRAAGAPLFPSERRRLDGPGARVSDRRGAPRRWPTRSPTHLPGWAGRLTPHVLRHYCASQLYQAGRGHHRDPGTARPFLDRHDDAVRPRARTPASRTPCCSGQQRAAAAVGRTDPMKWNLRLAAANRGIWKASELRRMLAERGPGDQRREDVGAVVGPAERAAPGGARRVLRGPGLRDQRPDHRRTGEGPGTRSGAGRGRPRGRATERPTPARSVRGRDRAATR